jgi:hypothetical protein
MEDKKAIYLRALIIYNDILTYHNDLNVEEDENKKFRLFKNCFVALDLFRDSFKHFNDFIKDNEGLIQKSRSIKKRLEFVNHLRNKISGHLDHGLLLKAVQWEPQIFRNVTKPEKELQLLLTYKTLLESGINSYLDAESNQKVFDTEIDLFFPPNQALFFNYIGELNKDSIDFLKLIIDILESHIEFLSDDKLMEMARIAGMTDFRLT